MSRLPYVKECVRCGSSNLASRKYKYCIECHAILEKRYKESTLERYSGAGRYAYKGECLLCEKEVALEKSRRFCPSCVRMIRTTEFRHVIKCVKGERKCIDCGTSQNFRTTSRCATCDSHYKRLRTYGLTKQQYEKMVSAQENKCIICKRHESECIRRERKVFKGLVIDHCHKTGKVRGLLCIRCNVAIGYIEQEEDRIEKMIAYLRGTAPNEN